MELKNALIVDENNVETFSEEEVLANKSIDIQSKLAAEIFCKRFIATKIVENITTLSLMNCDLNDNIEALSGLTIAELFLGGNENISDKSIAIFTSMPSLQFIGLGKTQITDACDLSSTCISDLTVERLKGMPLEHLDLSLTAVTNSPAQSLQSNTHLKMLLLVEQEI